MVSFGSSNKEEGFYALFDIASTSIGVSLVKKGVVPKLLWSKRLEFSFTGTDEYSRYVRTMYATLLEAGMKMISEGVKVVSRDTPSFSVRSMQVHCILGTPWYFGTVSRSKQSKEKKFFVTPLEIQSLEASACANARERQELDSWQEVMGSPLSFETYPLIFLLNGYTTTSILRRSVNEIEGIYYSSFIAESIKKNIEEVVSRVVPNHDIVYHSSAHILSEYSRVLSKKNFVLLEVTGEITQLFLFKKGVLHNLSTIPKGSNHLLKSENPKALSVDEAKSAFEVFKKKKQMTFEKLSHTLQEELLDWKEHCLKGVGQISNGVVPPKHFVLFTEDEWTPFYRTLFENEWELPGMRTPVDIDSIELRILPSKGERDREEGDLRLSTFAMLLPFCTSEKGVWYTKK